MNLLVTLTVAERIAMILEGLGRAVAARITPRRPGGAMVASLILLVWTRIRRVDGQIQWLLALFLAGRLRVVVGVQAGRGGAGVPGVMRRVPSRFGWLLGLVPYEAAGFASQLRAVLAEPEMVALLEASPQARGVLGPLCRMLGVERSVLRVPAVVAGEVSPAVSTRVRVAPAAVPSEPWRIPLPRGGLAKARREEFGKG
jgi:hypothetical protein